jgi:hypothetical protein
MLLDCPMRYITPLPQAGIKKKPSLDGLFLKVLTLSLPGVNFKRMGQTCTVFLLSGAA